METDLQTPPRPRRKNAVRDALSKIPEWMWWAGTAVASVTSGLMVVASRVWEYHYDEIKKTNGIFRELREGGKDGASLPEMIAGVKIPENLRNGAHPAYDAILQTAIKDDGNPLSAAEKFSETIAARSAIQQAHKDTNNKLLKAIFGIESEGLLGRIKGAYQRFKWIGPNNKNKALLAGAISLAPFTIAMLLRENIHIWNQLDEARIDSAEDKKHNNQLVDQLRELSAKTAAENVSLKENTPASSIQTYDLTHEKPKDTGPNRTMHHA